MRKYLDSIGNQQTQRSVGMECCFMCRCRIGAVGLVLAIGCNLSLMLRLGWVGFGWTGLALCVDACVWGVPARRSVKELQLGSCLWLLGHQPRLARVWC